MVNVKWPQKVHACLGFLAQISWGGREGTNSHSGHRNYSIVNELEYVIGPGP